MKRRGVRLLHHLPLGISRLTQFPPSSANRCLASRPVAQVSPPRSLTLPVELELRLSCSGLTGRVKRLDCGEPLSFLLRKAGHGAGGHTRCDGLYGAGADQDPPAPSPGTDHDVDEPAGRAAARVVRSSAVDRAARPDTPGSPAGNGRRSVRLRLQLPATRGVRRDHHEDVERPRARRGLQRRLSAARRRDVRGVVREPTSGSGPRGKGRLRPARTVWRARSREPSW